MNAQTQSDAGQPVLHPDFVPDMVRTVNDSDEHGVHLLFNKWWQYAPSSTIEAYREHLQIKRWEAMFDQPLAEVRQRYGVPGDSHLTPGESGSTRQHRALFLRLRHQAST